MCEKTVDLRSRDLVRRIASNLWLALSHPFEGSSSQNIAVKALELEMFPNKKSMRLHNARKYHPKLHVQRKRGNRMRINTAPPLEHGHNA